MLTSEFCAVGLGEGWLNLYGPIDKYDHENTIHVYVEMSVQTCII